VRRLIALFPGYAPYLWLRCRAETIRDRAQNVPATYRGATPKEPQQPESESLGDQKWWEVFQDQQLQDLIHTALQQNYDVRIAATRILEARAQVGITRRGRLADD